ncbi:hypothetical protein K440DRAFT_577226 [Wilcoxina mikolae CBS 423.85]|nr:hypothetical protein K440DRAFT_577226 [Wilcoxina mikolae CBS 423.85]
MLYSIFSSLHRSSSSPPQSTYSPPAQSKRSAFHLLASLQLAVRTPSSEPTLTTEKPFSSSDYLSTTNTPTLRSQGKLCLTFALSTHQGSNAEKIKIVDELEACVNAAFFEEDYRRRIYALGGLLAGDVEVWEGLRMGGRGVAEQLAVGR